MAPMDWVSVLDPPWYWIIKSKIIARDLEGGLLSHQVFSVI